VLGVLLLVLALGTSLFAYNMFDNHVAAVWIGAMTSRSQSEPAMQFGVTEAEGAALLIQQANYIEATGVRLT
jgi:hypothetical protein